MSGVSRSVGGGAKRERSAAQTRSAGTPWRSTGCPRLGRGADCRPQASVGQRWGGHDRVVFHQLGVQSHGPQRLQHRQQCGLSSRCSCNASRGGASVSQCKYLCFGYAQCKHLRRCTRRFRVPFAWPFCCVPLPWELASARRGNGSNRRGARGGPQDA
jgi:hypothetical protein